jgi:hypothetical protein
MQCRNCGHDVTGTPPREFPMPCPGCGVRLNPNNGSTTSEPRPSGDGIEAKPRPLPDGFVEYPFVLFP